MKVIPRISEFVLKAVYPEWYLDTLCEAASLDTRK